MSITDRRAAARRRAWGRGPMILRFESLEGRILQAVAKPDIILSGFASETNTDWGQPIHVSGDILNRGNGAVNAPFKVGIYASSGKSIGPGSVYLGYLNVPSGLAPGQSYHFDQTFNMSPSPVPGVGSSQTVYLGVRVDNDKQIVESNEANNDNGKAAQLHINAAVPANLVATSFNVTPNAVTWGDSLSVTAQIKNQSVGDAPATRARIVLTPAGATPGGNADVTVASIAVPAIPSYQAANITQAITLPAAPPGNVGQASQFTVSIVPDADFVTQPIGPRIANQGNGLDSVPITISPAINSDIESSPKPDLAAAGVQVPTNDLVWGTSFDVTATVQNIGQGDANDVRVRFFLTGITGATDRGLFLGDAIVSAIAPGSSQNVTKTLKLPSRVPAGMTIANVIYGRIVVVVDAENMVDENIKSNNTTGSTPVVLRLLSSDGSSTVPVTPKATKVVKTTTGTTGTAKVIKARKKQQKSTGDKIVDNLKSIPKATSDFFKKLNIFGANR